MSGLVNGLYPLDYFQLDGVEQIGVPTDSFWASAERHASVSPRNERQFVHPDRGGVVTSEYQEIDLGRVRQINAITMDVSRMPYDIEIEYDALSGLNEERRWVPVRRVEGEPFDSIQRYDASARHMWRSVRFHFTDALGGMVNTRRVRIRYKRRWEPWPTTQSPPIPYSIFVKNLRTMRLVGGERDVVGPLFRAPIDDTTTLTPIGTPSTSGTVAQRFVYPPDAKRGEITPRLMGFSVLIDVAIHSTDGTHADFHGDHTAVDPESRVSYRWTLADVDTNEVLDSGTATGTATDGKSWLDIHTKVIRASTDRVYELRLTSLTPDASHAIYTNANTVPPLTIEGVSFTASSVEASGATLKVGDHIRAGGATYLVAATEGDSFTLDRAYPSTETTSIERISHLSAPAARTVAPILGTFGFTNDSAEVTFTPDGDNPLRFTTPGFSNGSSYTDGDIIYVDGDAHEALNSGTATTPGAWADVGETTTAGDVDFLNLGPDPTYNLLKPGDYISLSEGGSSLLKVSAVEADGITLTADFTGSTHNASIYRVTIESGVNPGDLAGDPSRCLTMRVWADVADSGRDVLGNEYRYGTHYDDADRLLDEDSPGWMSAPQPSPEAVEALYFDVRDTSDQVVKLSVVDVIKIAPRTPGVRMHVYYNKDGLKGRAPETRDEWDRLVWTPVNEVYTLRKENAIELPSPIKAAFIKLEFTALRPMPFKVPAFPEPRSVEYQRHPTWVEEQFTNAQVREVVEDWFVSNAKTVQWQMLRTLRDPILEFQYKQREFMASLARGDVISAKAINAGIVDPASRSFVDPATASKIRLGMDRSFGSLQTTLRTDDLLGRAVVNRYDPRNSALASESTFRNQRRTTPYTSSVGGRITESFSQLANTPMWFNRRCRHIYRTDRGKFNRKAYYVGIKSVEFSRNDYTIEHDDAIIEDNLNDDAMLEINTFAPETQTRIPDATDLIAASLVPVSAFISYEVDGVHVTDETMTLFGFEQSRLSLDGHATNIRMHSERNGAGVEYMLERDYLVSHERERGVPFTTVGRSDLSERIVVPPLEGGESLRDAAIVVAVYEGQAFEEDRDSAVVWAFAQIDSFNPVDYYDTVEVEPSAEIEIVDFHDMRDSADVESDAEIEAVLQHGSIDGAAVEGVAQTEFELELMEHFDSADVEVEGRPVIDTYGGVEFPSDYGGGSFGDLAGLDEFEE